MKPQLQIFFDDAEVIPLEIVNEVPLEAKARRVAGDRAFEKITEWMNNFAVENSCESCAFERTVGQIIRDNGSVVRVRGLYPREYRDAGDDRIFKFVYDQAETGALVYLTAKELYRLWVIAWMSGAFFGVFVTGAAILVALLIFK